VVLPRGAEPPHSPSSGRQDHALANGLGIEQAVSLLRLIEPPAMGEEPVDGDMVVGNADSSAAFSEAVW
jgi:hypothetical protein